MVLNLAEATRGRSRIKVIGVGGAGGNAINRMIASQIESVEYVAVNTDLQALTACLAKERVQIGRNVTGGLGAGGNPEVGRQAATEDTDLLTELLDDTEIVFLTAGFGGGTGTGATPVLARIAKEKGILTIAIVTKPFAFEKSVRHHQAEEGLRELRATIDTVMTIPNERIFEIADANLSLLDAYSHIDAILCQSVQAIARLITRPGLINIDFADIRTVMSIKGSSVLGFGEASGKDKASVAMQQAIDSPMLEEKGIRGARGILLSMVAGPDLLASEFSEAVRMIQDITAPDANVIFGYNVEPEMTDTVIVTLIATGLELEGLRQRAATREAKEKPKRVIDLFGEGRVAQIRESALVREGTMTYRGENLEEPTYLRRRTKRDEAL